MEKPSCFSASLPSEKFEKLKALLLEQGFSLTRPNYTYLQGKKEGISVTLYMSGKLTVQGKGKDPFIEFYLEPQILESVAYTCPHALTDLTPRIGVDEAGKGDFFGALCTAAVYADEPIIQQFIKLGLRDSKTLTDEKSIALSKKIKAIAPVDVLILRPEKYNELYGRFHNLNRLLAWCHASVITNLFTKTGCTFATIDQFGAEYLVETALKKKNEHITLKQQHKGEQDIVIAAASIVARAAFVETLAALGDAHGLVLPKGASQVVKKTARSIYASSPELLPRLVKTHFKTYTEVTGDA